MTLIEQINADFIQAFKDSKTDETKKSVKDFLGVLKTEVTRESKTPEDNYVIGKIKSMIKNAEETDSLSEAELNILNAYLPKQLNEAELGAIIEANIADNGYAGMQNMGKVMSYLKENYGGQYDGKMASDLVKKSL